MYESRGREPQNRTITRQRNIQKKDSYKKPNGFLSFILYLFTTIFILVFIILMVLKSAVVSNVIQNTDFLHYLEAVAVDEHEYYIVDQFNNMPFNNNDITLEDIEDFIKKDSVSGGIGSIVEGYAQAFAMNNLDHHVTAGEVMVIARDLNDDLSEFFNHDMSDDDIEYLVERLDDLLDFNSMTIDGLMEDFDMDMSTSAPLLLLSPALRWLIGSLCVFMLIAIFAIRKENIPGACFAVGIPIALAGLISFSSGIFLDTATNTPDSFFQQFERFLEEPIAQIMQYGFIFTAIGTLICIVAKTFKWAGKRG